MSSPTKRHSVFVRIFIGLSILFFVSLGLCGMNGVFASFSDRLSNNGAVVATVLVIEIGGILVSVLGLFVTGIVWLIMLATGSHTTPPPPAVTPAEDDEQH
jgi:hypothetical protein